MFSERPQQKIRLGREIPVARCDGFSVFSTYGTTPESPGRQVLAWTHFPYPPVPPGKRHQAEIWISRLGAGRPTKLTEVRNIDAHNGARVDWVNDDVILYFDDAQAKVRRIDGTLLYAKSGLPGEATSEDQVLVFQPDLTEPADGLYVLNIRTGDYTRLLSKSQLSALRSGRLTHPRFSPDGRHIGFCLGEDFYSLEVKTHRLIRLGPAPMHWLWFDHDTIAGHTSSWGMGKRYTLQGRELELLSGPGNHMAVSPGGHMIASDTDYGSSTVRLSLYRRGETEGIQVFSSDLGETVWNLECHINPSFARDNSRIYYNRPTGPTEVRAFSRTICIEVGDCDPA